MSEPHSDPVQAGWLKMLLRAIVANDTKYEIRYGLLLRALAVAQQLGYGTSIRSDLDPPHWPVVVIDLPEVGQVSWHVRPALAWDGHSKAEKFARIEQFCGQGE